MKHQLSRHQMSRRAFLHLSAGVAAGTLISACAMPTQPATTGAAEAGAPAQEAVSIRFWNVWGAAREELMNEIIGHFEEENPGISVENLVQPFENRAENLFASIASNEPPEVLMATRAELLQFADEGLIIAIDDYVEQNELDLSRFFEAEINNMRWQDRLYSMPMPTGGGITCLELVNLDMLSAAGQEAVIPQTWQELEDLAREFTVLDDRGIVQLGANITGTDVPGFVGSFFAWLYCNGGRIYNEELTQTTFNSEEGVATLEWMVNFTNDIYGGIQNYIDFSLAPGEATEAQPWYNDVQLVNFPNVSIFFHMQTFRPDMNWDMGVRPYNGNNPNATSQGLSGEEFAWSYVIPQSVAQERQEAAFKWVQKITYDDNGACWFMQQQGRPSPIIACNEDPVYYDANPHWDKVLDSLATDVSVDIIPPHTRIRDLVGQAVQSALFGDASPADALNQAAEQSQAIVDEFRSS
jgi:multiple sugar transport system substrate-binding protein